MLVLLLNLQELSIEATMLIILEVVVQSSMVAQECSIEEE
jgi:hypothetical protein